MENEVLRTIAQRYSCRAFTDEAPAPEQLDALAQAAVQSPSGMNKQDWRVIIVRNRKLMAALEEDALSALKAAADQSTYDRIMSRGGLLFYNAPVLLMVAYKPSPTFNTGIDVGILCENIALAAHSLGLATCIHGLAGIPFGGPHAAEYKQRFGFPEGYEFGIAVLAGYAKPEFPKAPHEPDSTKVSYID